MQAAGSPREYQRDTNCVCAQNTLTFLSECIKEVCLKNALSETRELVAGIPSGGRRMNSRQKVRDPRRNDTSQRHDLWGWGPSHKKHADAVIQHADMQHAVFVMPAITHVCVCVCVGVIDLIDPWTYLLYTAG